VRVRGLKQPSKVGGVAPAKSHPVRVRGLKRGNGGGMRSWGKSHPVRVRGLKLNMVLLKTRIM